MNKVLLTEHFATPSGHIQQKKLFNFLYGSSVSTRSKSGSSSDAQTPVMCNAGTDWEATHRAVRLALNKMFKEFKPLYYFTTIQMAGGLRVSEVLNISIYDITQTGLIKIKTLKGGSSKVISVSEAREFLFQCKKDTFLPWQNWNRFFVYREYKRFGVPSVRTGADRHAVTHLFRHLQTAELRLIGADERATAKFLGHKSLKSQKNYGK